MSKFQLSFFASSADLVGLLRDVESREALRYAKAGLFDNPKVEMIDSLLSPPNLGFLSHGDHNQTQCFLAMREGVSVTTRPVLQRRGGIKYAVDQQQNPKTVSFRPSGLFVEKCMIDGAVGTISRDPYSVALYELFEGHVKERFRKVHEYFVGEEATELLSKGWRFTYNARAPRLYDLKSEG